LAFVWFLNYWKKNPPEMVKSVVAAAEGAGVPYKVKPNPSGGDGSARRRFVVLSSTAGFPRAQIARRPIRSTPGKRPHLRGKKDLT